MSEEEVISKVQDLMKALDQVKRYKALSKLLIDFFIILLTSAAVLFTFEIIINLLGVSNDLPSYFSSPIMLTTTGEISYNYLATPIWQFVIAVLSLLILGVGFITGLFWVDRKLKQVKTGTWQESLNMGFPGALKLLQGLDWNGVFDDIRISKITYAVYSMVKVVCYWAAAFILLFFSDGFAISLVHLTPIFYPLALISLALVIILSRGDLQKRYRQVVSLDVLMWELRWFYSDFRSAEFKA